MEILFENEGERFNLDMVIINNTRIKYVNEEPFSCVINSNGILRILFFSIEFLLLQRCTSKNKWIPMSNFGLFRIACYGWFSDLITSLGIFIPILQHIWNVISKSNFYKLAANRKKEKKLRQKCRDEK